MAENRLNALDELLKELDDPCQFILAGITIHPEGIGFNKLTQRNQKTKYLQQNVKNRFVHTS